MKEWIENRFKLRQLGTDFRTEIIAGLTTFSAMSYILVVHPATMAAAGMEQAALVTVTALASALGCLLMGGACEFAGGFSSWDGDKCLFRLLSLWDDGNSLAGGSWLRSLKWASFFLLTLTGMRRRLFDCVPPCLKIGVQCGIGLFIAFIGLSQSGLIVDHTVTLVTIGEMPSASGLIVGLQNRGIPGAILIGIIVVALLGLLIRGEDGEGFTRLPDHVFSKPVSIAPTLLQVDFLFPLC
jgi:AGZA family xanthine/uracil permease-like MFS transporter